MARKQSIANWISSFGHTFFLQAAFNCELTRIRHGTEIRK